MRTTERTSSIAFGDGGIWGHGSRSTGIYKPVPDRRARTLLEEGLIDFVATDHHGAFRDHNPGLIHRALSRAAGEGDAVELMASAPAALLQEAGVGALARS